MLKIKVAGHLFGLENRYEEIAKMSRDYICEEGNPEVIFSITEEEREFENQTGFRYDAGWLEGRAFHRKVSRFLFDYDMLLFHCVAVKKGGKAYLFTAPSGTGKTTHARQWLKAYGADVEIINGDTPMLEFCDGGEVIVHGSPWCGKEGYQTNTSAPLGAIVVLHQSEENKISGISGIEAYRALLEQAFRSKVYGESEMLKTLELVDRLCHAVPLYSLGCTISEDAARLCHNTIVKE